MKDYIGPDLPPPPIVETKITLSKLTDKELNERRSSAVDYIF